MRTPSQCKNKHLFVDQFSGLWPPNGAQAIADRTKDSINGVASPGRAKRASIVCCTPVGTGSYTRTTDDDIVMGLDG